MNPEKFAEELYNLKLGEKSYPSNNEIWIRIPGGWAYGNIQGIVFVPFDNEFQTQPKKRDNNLDF